MKTITKILGHSMAMTIIWILSILISQGVIEMDIEEDDNGAFGLVMLFLTCLINVTVIHLYLSNTTLTRKQVFWRVTVIIFGIQYFLSQIETLYFIDSTVLSTQSVLSILFSGLLLASAYGWLTSRTYHTEDDSQVLQLEWNTNLVLKFVFLALLAYPALYFFAGYFIAWQSESLRVFYTGSSELKSFWSMMSVNLKEGLYTFQIFRSVLWILIGMIVLVSFNGSKIQCATVLGLLFAMLMNAQHLIPNPIWSTEIRLYHFVETASSNFIWGALLGWLVHSHLKQKTPWTERQLVDV